MPNRWLYLASTDDLIDMVAHPSRYHDEWPPPGVEIRWSPQETPDGNQVVNAPGGDPTFRLQMYGSGNVEEGADGDVWRTTLGRVLLDLDLVDRLEASVLLRLLDRVAGATFGNVSAWPVLYTNSGLGFMRWIKSIVAGSLAGVEQFQFQINWGKPGADPNPTEAQLVAIGEDLRDRLETALNANQALLGGVPGTSAWSGEVKFVELGVVLEEQTEATNKDGTGGNLSQSTETKWAAINTVNGITGISAQHSLPFEVACAVTLHTNHRGPSGRGRFYLPSFQITTMDTGGRFLANQAQGAAKIFTDWMTAVKGSQDLVPVVVSRRRIILNEVVQVSVGVIPDSQRRRRWAQDEAPVIVWP